MTEMRIFDLRVTVESIEGRSVCGLEVGDYFELTESSRVRIPDGKHFFLYALQSVLPLLPAKQRRLPDEDWLEQDNLVCCPDPLDAHRGAHLTSFELGLEPEAELERRQVSSSVRIERIGERTLRTEELT